MRDGQGNRLSPEEQQKVRSIQGAPDKESVGTVSINPEPKEDSKEPAEKPGQKPAAGGAE